MTNRGAAGASDPSAAKKKADEDAAPVSKYNAKTARGSLVNAN